VIQIENVCSRVGSLFVQDGEAKCQKLIEDSSDMLFPDCFVLPKSSNVNFPTKTERGALFFVMLSGPATVLNVPGLKVVVLTTGGLARKG
jgi:hypothetical protein